ncbi:MAG: YfhO family protein [Sulfuritalea sp.]|nr:YfhO family protein [Sulfuritalea sp.]
MLLALQILVASVIYWKFLNGSQYFAFADIGSDTYTQFIPLAMHMADYLGNEGFPGWSFQVGLGASLGMLTDPFLLLSTVFGAEAVPGLRIWIFMLKIACGGAFFLQALLALELRREAALVGALAYSFCGYLLIDGQWDPHASEFVFHALLLWVVVRHRRNGGVLVLPLAVAAMAASGIFMFSVGIFLALLFIANLVGSEQRQQVARDWCLKTFPLALLGLLIAAPIVIPNAMQLLDSPRVTGTQSMFADRLRDLASPNAIDTVFAQLAGFWHKDIVGIGNNYRGWMNYLEGPGFWVGILPLLLIPQLWRGVRSDRIWLIAGLATLAFYILSPFVRFAAFGFGQFYFRVSTLWVAMLLLVLFARALSIVLERGLDRRLFAVTAVVCLALLGAVVAHYQAVVRSDHVFMLLVLIGVATFGLMLWSRSRLTGSPVTIALLIFVAAEAMLIGWPSANEGRLAVTRQNFGYADATPSAVKFIKSQDPAFYRIEKTYESVGFCDSTAQGYFGVKSYFFHGSGIVAFNIALGLIPNRSRGTNFTNWLPGLGDRFALYSLLGVRYVVSPLPLHWPGFEAIAGNRVLTIYRNHYALPLGIVQEAQYPRERLAQLPNETKDLMMINAAIVERPIDGLRLADERDLDPYALDAVDRYLAQPAHRHQSSGLQVDRFSHQHITGRIPGGNGGILVFSIPNSPGWIVRIDGTDTPSFRANLGMLAVRIDRGPHAVELEFRQPGRRIGYAIGAVAAMLLALTWWLSTRRQWATAAGSL